MNKQNGKTYTGSAANLWSRILDYQQPAYQFTHQKDPLVRAFKKYGIHNFELHIVEITTRDKKELLKAEQRWLHGIRKEYNILKVAGSSIGYVHDSSAKKAISKQITGKSRSVEVRKTISARQIGFFINVKSLHDLTFIKKNTFFGKKHTEHALDQIKQSALNRAQPSKPGFSVSFTNVETQETTTTRSVRAAALALQTREPLWHIAQAKSCFSYKISVDYSL